MKQRLEKYSERFDNDKSAIGNPKTWGKRMVDEEESQNLKNFKKLVSDEVSPAMKDFIKEQETLEEIKLEEVAGSKYCKYSVIENKLAIIYKNQEKILTAIKLIKNEK